MKTAVIILISFLFACLNAIFPQKNEAILSGFVTDATTGEALVGTNILLYKDSLT
ncbi:MAG: hypothetical protein HXY50_02830, partial [Ignavibacteriaceae bacterium]|nr:hypothetical protein [Ignavibacteriaceae bacterium]